jgi:pilus assembly protein CpaE
VIVVSPEISEHDALDLSEHVGRTLPTTAVVVTREYVTNGFLTHAMRAGVRDVVDLARGNQELTEAVQRAIVWSTHIRSAQPQERQIQTQRGTVISVFSSKGGTGKTFLSSNLAAAIADRSRQDTAVLDLDIGMGDVFCYYGEDPVHSVSELFSIAGVSDRNMVHQLGTKFADHLWGFGTTPDPGNDQASGDSTGRLLTTLRSVYPFTVVDIGATYSEAALAAFDLSDTVCLVTALDVVGIRHLSKTLETLISIGVPSDRFMLVLNRADSKVGLDPKDVERVLKVQVDSLVPSSRLVPSSLNKGRLLYFEEPKSGVAQSIVALADKIIGSAPAGLTAPATDVLPESKARFLNRFIGGRDVTGRSAVEGATTR